MALAKQIIPGTEPGSSLSYGGQPPGSPDYPNLITSGYERRAAGIGRAYVDEYNQMLTNQYNNAYNYWLWQQQMEYNSPASQMARYLEAGLNPHYQTVEGGNAQRTPESSAQVRGNVRQNQLNAISTGVQVATSIASLVTQGITSLTKVASLPASISAYRKLLNQALGNKVEGSGLGNLLKRLDAFKEGNTLGMLEWQDGLPIMERGLYDPTAPFWRSQKYGADLLKARYVYQDLATQILEWKGNNLLPQQLENMKAQWEYLTAGTNLRNIEIDWKDIKEINGLVRPLIPLLGMLLFR